MKRVHAVVFMLSLALFTHSVYASDIVFADSLIAFSSQYEYNKAPGQYHARTVLGKPNILPDGTNSPCAWAPAREQSEQVEWIHVAFSKPIQARQIAIGENANAGTISRIVLYDKALREHEVYRRRADEQVSAKGRVFRHMLPRTPYAVHQLKVELDTRLVQGYNQIDFIAVLDREAPYEVRINSPIAPDKIADKERLGPEVNTRYAEISPVISPDGKTLYFTRDGSPENIGGTQQDIWFAEADGKGGFRSARNVGEPLNNASHNAVLSIAPDGLFAVLLNNYQGEGSTGGIAYSTRRGNNWTTPQFIRIENFYNRNRYAEYFLANDGLVLLLTVERDDSYGSKDVYVSFRVDSTTFGEPRNLGPMVNTAASEKGPFLAADGRSLYYSTDGLPGKGNSDVYMTRRLDDTWTAWSEPINLSSINTPGFDAYFTIPATGEYAYFVSNGVSGVDNDQDIYRVRLDKELQPEPVVYIRGTVYNGVSKKPLGAEISYEDLHTAKPVGVARSSDINGEYSIVLPAGSWYGFLAKAENFIPVADNFDTRNLAAYAEIRRDLYLYPLEKGQTIRLNNVFFDFDRYTLRPEALPELNRLVALLQNNKNMHISLAGHTDSRGEDTYNMTLSRNRAKTVYEYLLEQGIGAERLQYEGFGENKPVADNSSDEGRSQNRRVEFVIEAL